MIKGDTKQNMQDNLYETNIDHVPPFSFDAEVANRFNDMAQRSIPCYEEVLNLSAQICSIHYSDQYVIYDIGCSTGNLIKYLNISFKANPFQYVGVDSSAPMLEQARKVYPEHTFSQKKVETMKWPITNIIICNYTLQFIPILIRRQILQAIYRTLTPGGILILSEKISNENTLFANLHHEYKYKNGYSRLAIQQNEVSLNNVLITATLTEYFKWLEQSGFNHTSILFKWCQFVSIIATKT